MDSLIYAFKMESACWNFVAERTIQMRRSYTPEFRRRVIRLARAGTAVEWLAITMGMSDATIYSWLKQDCIDRPEVDGATTSQQLELAAVRRPIKQLETELTLHRH